MIARHFTPWALAFTLCALFAGPATGREQTWIRVQGRYATLYSQAGRDEAVALANRVDEFGRILQREGLRVVEPAHMPTTLIGFDDVDAFHAVHPSPDGKLPLLASYAGVSRFGHWIAFLELGEVGAMSVQEQFAETSTFLLDDELPTALGVGLGLYYATAEWDAQGVRFGRELPVFLTDAREDDFTNFDEHLGFRGAFSAAPNGVELPTFARRSWALVHYLMSVDGDGAGCIEFVHRVARGEEPRSAYEAVFAPARWQDLGPAVKQHVREPIRLRVAPPLAAAPEWDYRATEAPKTEVEANVNLLRIVSGDHTEEFTRRLRDAARWELAGGLGQVMFGLHESFRDEDAAAYAAFHSVGELESASPLALAVAGTGILFAGDFEQNSDGPTTREAYELLRRSTEMDSTNAVALGWCVSAALALGEEDGRALDWLERASRVMPTETPFVLARALLLAKRGKAAEGRTLMKQHPKLSEDPERRVRVLAVLDRAIVADSVRAAFDARDLATARAILARAEAGGGDEEWLRSVRAMAAKADSADRLLRAQECIQRAAKLASKQNWTAAKPLLEQAAALNPDPAARPRLEEALRFATYMVEYEAALALLRKGSYEQAARAFERARDLAPTDEDRERAITRAKESRALLPGGSSGR